MILVLDLVHICLAGLVLKAFRVARNVFKLGALLPRARSRPLEQRLQWVIDLISYMEPTKDLTMDALMSSHVNLAGGCAVGDDIVRCNDR